jgi:hypothetical protein
VGVWVRGGEDHEAAEYFGYEIDWDIAGKVGDAVNPA